MSIQIPNRMACGSVSTVFALMISAMPAMAYVGPGAGLTAIGTMIAVIAIIMLAIVGFVWYPLKRAMRKKKANTEESHEPR
ncbi:MAG: hypothetical protein ACRC2W_15330 [Plesiomonas shigelloides]